MSKDTSVNIRLTSETKKRLEEIAKEKNISLAQLSRETLEELVEPKKDKKDNRYQFLDDGCILRDYLDIDEIPIGRNHSEGFYCLKKAPSLIRLGSGIESAASKICAKCILREGAKEYETRKKEGIKIEMARCSKGGHLNEDMTLLYCPLIGRFRPIENKKKKTDYKPCRLEGPNNARCKSLKYSTVIKGLKDSDKDER